MKTALIFLVLFLSKQKRTMPIRPQNWLHPIFVTWP